MPLVIYPADAGRWAGRSVNSAACFGDRPDDDGGCVQLGAGAHKRPPDALTRKRPKAESAASAEMRCGSATPGEARPGEARRGRGLRGGMNGVLAVGPRRRLSVRG